MTHLWIILSIMEAAFIFAGLGFGFLVRSRRSDSADDPSHVDGAGLQPEVGDGETGSSYSSSGIAELGHGHDAEQLPSSSGSVSAESGQEFEVFLSFRGTDTRRNFTDFLYHDLNDVGVRAFRDNDELRVGKEIGPELMSAIQQSKISVPIFTRGYASSKWCLREVAEMVKCMKGAGTEQLIMPIFLDVTPDEVKHQSGSYAEAFARHKKNFDVETVKGWRDALKEVVKLKGLELNIVANGHQGKLIKIIVEKILRELKKAHLCVSNNLVGIDDRVEAVMGMLSVDAPDVRFIGIWGMGGIGKTTLAKFIYNQILADFDRCSFLQDVRETSTRSHNGLRKLQSQLFSDLLRCGRRVFATSDEGTYELKRRFRGKKVLILLDDVDHVDQLSALAADIGWFGRGSRIIITTRNKDILRVAWEHQVYEVREMAEAHALQLFCKHALRKDAPTIELRALSEEIVNRTGGLPLALEVIGSFLHGKSEDIWKSTSRKLKLVPNKEIEHRLRISYDALEHGQQQMFLDIACLFIGKDKGTVAYIWEDRYSFPPEADIEVLQLLCLIKIGNGKWLGMHDQLQVLGREIVRRENYDEPGKRSRLWGNEAVDVLLNNQGSSSVQGIRLEYQVGLEDQYFTPEQFRELPKLRFLQLDCANLAGDFEYLLPELRWLQWKVSSFKCGTTNLNLKNLLILDVSNSRVTHNWNIWNTIEMMAVKLKLLDLSYCKELIRTPCLAAFHNLERLDVRNCESLEVIDPSIGKLKHLAFLNMGGCRYVRELPEQMDCKETLSELVIDGTGIKELPRLEGLKNLRILSATHCEYLTKFPSSVSHLTSLTDLRLAQSRISELPESIGLLVTVRRLTLEGTLLKVLPKSIGGMKSLVELGLSKTKVALLPDSVEYLINLEELRIGHSAVHCLPAALGQLEKLRSIDASGCRLLGQIASELGNLSSLKVLLLRHTNITSIPETIRGLTCLETLDLAWCTQLKTLPELPSSLCSMSVTCQSFVPIPNLSDLINLKELEFVRSTVPKETLELAKLEKLHISRSNVSILLDEIGVFQMLRELFIGNVSLHCIPKLPSGLHRLFIMRCHSLARLTEVSNLENLSELRIHGCPELVEIEGLGELLSLKFFSISFCASIANVDGLEMLESLKYLDVSASGKLERLADLSKLSGLFSLCVRGSPKLAEIQGLRSLHALEKLEISESSIETLDGLSCLKSLRHLQLDCCNMLRRLEGLDELEKLFYLIISRCQSIERLVNLSNLKRLNYLTARNCEKLEGLDGLGELEGLKGLCVGGCVSIEKLPNLSKLKFLDWLDASGCEKLQGLGGLEVMERIESLTLSGCKSIERLPDLLNLKSLKHLSAKACEKLQGLEGLEGLERIESLALSGCKSIVRLPDLSNLISLKCLHAEECEKLQGLEGLEKLGALEELNIRGCKSIEKLPSLSSLTFLEYLDADYCEKLQGVHGLKVSKKPPKQRNIWERCLFANCYEKLQELDGLDELSPHTVSYFSFGPESCSEEFLNQSNVGLLKQWYADGCEKVPELEGLENLERYHLEVIPDVSGRIYRISGLRPFPG